MAINKLSSVNSVSANVAISPKHNFPEEKKEQNKKQKNENSHKSENHSTDFVAENNEEDLVLGKLLIQKKSLEIELYSIVLNKKNINNYESMVGIIKNKIRDIDNKILNIDDVEEPLPANEDYLGYIISGLIKLKKMYLDFKKIVIKEAELISQDNFDALTPLMEKKNLILDKIDYIYNKVEFSQISTFLSNNPKRIKAELIVSDIKAEVKLIIKLEDSYSVELQSKKSELQFELGKTSAGVRTIRGYSSKILKPQFIDTSK